MAYGRDEDEGLYINWGCLTSWYELLSDSINSYSASINPISKGIHRKAKKWIHNDSLKRTLTGQGRAGYKVLSIILRKKSFQRYLIISMQVNLPKWKSKTFENFKFISTKTLLILIGANVKVAFLYNKQFWSGIH